MPDPTVLFLQNRRHAVRRKENLMEVLHAELARQVESECRRAVERLSRDFLGLQSGTSGRPVSVPETNIFNDISKGTLPSMSWVIPDAVNSDHPGYGSDTGPSWIASVVNAIGESSYWDSTAIVVVWDDREACIALFGRRSSTSRGGPGFRVGAISSRRTCRRVRSPTRSTSSAASSGSSRILGISDIWAPPTKPRGALRTCSTSTNCPRSFNEDHVELLDAPTSCGRSRRGCPSILSSPLLCVGNSRVERLLQKEGRILRRFDRNERARLLIEVETIACRRGGSRIGDRKMP